MRFADLRLIEPLVRAVESEGYSIPTPIQAQAIGPILDGSDVLGSAQTGTGKTAAFALPMLQLLSQRARPSGHSIPRPRALILCPTRELATQIGQSFTVYGQNLRLRSSVVFGGVSQVPQVASIRRGTDILVATPGRLLDLMAQGHADLRSIEILVLDEADRMLDMGFIHDIRRITAQVPEKRQTLFFSATMPREIRELADALLRNPVSIEVAPTGTPAADIDQSVYFVDRKHKGELLAHLVDHLPMTRAIVFTRTKRGADRVVRGLKKRGIRAEAIHSDKAQGARQRAMESFRAGKIPVLVATDIASRGLDIDGITHVVNYDITHEPETYIHRIGRTARAGAAGSAVSLCDHEEVPNLRAIEKLIRRTIAVRTDHPSYVPQAAAPATGNPRHHDRAAGDRQQPPQGRRDAQQAARQAARQAHGSPASRPSHSAHNANTTRPATGHRQRQEPAAQGSQQQARMPRSQVRGEGEGAEFPRWSGHIAKSAGAASHASSGSRQGHNRNSGGGRGAGFGHGSAQSRGGKYRKSGSKPAGRRGGYGRA